MAKRYSGRAIVTVIYDDKRSQYKASVATEGKNRWSGYVGAPRSGGGAVDSPAAYDRTAQAALAFALDDGADIAMHVDWTPSGVYVGRSYATRHPKQANPSRKTAKPAASKRVAYNVSVWDEEGGYWHYQTWMLGTSAKAVEKAYLRHYPDLDSDDVQVKKQTHRKRKQANPSRKRVFGSKRDYPKIDILVKRGSDWRYAATTTWSPTLREAKAVFLDSNPDFTAATVKVMFQSPRKSR